MSDRGMSASMLTEVDADEKDHHYLLELQFDGGTLYFTTAGYDITYGGNTYTPGDFLSVGSIRETLEIEIRRTVIEMSGANLTNISTALSENFVNRTAIIYLAFVDSNHTVIADPIKHQGFLSGYKPIEDPDSGSILRWTISNHWEDWDRVNGRRTNNNSHKIRYPTDTFFENADKALDNIQWGGQSHDVVFHGGIGGSGSGPTGGSPVFGRKKQDPTDVERPGNDTPIPVIYGQRRVFGIPIFKAVSGTNNEYLDIVYVIGEGECDSLVETWVNGKLSTHADYVTLLDSEFFSGTASQTVSTALQARQPDWKSTSVGTDTCYVVTRTKWAGLFNAEPQYEFVVKGKKCLEKIGETTVWTENLSWHNYDFATSTRYGKGVPEAEMHEQSFIDAANFFDTSVNSCATGTHAIISGGHLVNTSRLLIDNMRELVRNARSWLTESEGLIKIIVDKDETSSFSYTTNHVKGKWDFGDSGKRGRFNRFEVSYIKPGDNNEYKTDIADFEDAAIRSGQDGDKILEGRAQYKSIDNYCRAKRYAEFDAEKSRDALKPAIKCSYKTLRVEVGDVVDITHETPAWSAKEFRCFEIEITEATILHKLREHDSNNYTITAVADPTAPPGTTLPDIFTVVAPTSFNVASGDAELDTAPDGTIISQARLTWVKSADPFLGAHEIRWKKSADSGYDTRVVDEDVTEVILKYLEDNTLYDFGVRAHNGSSPVQKSEWVNQTNHLFLGKAAPPPDVTQFLVFKQPDGTREFTWTYASPPLDHAGFIIKYALGSGLAWAALSSVPGAEELPKGIRSWERNVLSAGSYTFGIKAIDTSGNESTNAVLIDITLGDPRIDESFVIVDLFVDGWSGTKTQCHVARDNGILYALDQEDWDDKAVWDDWTPWATDPFLSITYEHPAIDIGAIVDFTPLVNILHDGTTTTIQEAHSDTDSGYTAFADIGPLVNARWVKFKVVITKTSGLIAVTGGEIILSGTPIVEYIEDLDTSTLTGANRIAVGHVKIPFTKAFARFRHANVVSIQNVSAGWDSVLISKLDLTNGAEIKIYNSSAVLADATIDFKYQGV